MKIVIIGGIAAGMSVAAKAKRENPHAHITVLEKEPYISFVSSSLTYYLGNQFTEEKRMFARTPEAMSEQGIHIYTSHQVVAVDFDQKNVTALKLSSQTLKEFNYDRLMIATGASPIIPPLPGIEAKNIYTLTKLPITKQLKTTLPTLSSLAIIGGGFIGVEAAEQLIQMGKQITLIEATPHLMSKPFDPDFSGKIYKILVGMGVNVRLNTLIKGFQVTKTGQATHLYSEHEYFNADAIILAIGFKPATEFLTDQRLKKAKNGALVINKWGETSIPDVFSAGDCATIPHKFLKEAYFPLGTGANKMGRVIGSNIVSASKKKVSYPGSLGSSALKIGDYEAGSTGLTETLAKALSQPYKTTTIQTNTHPPYYPDRTPLNIKLLYEPTQGTLLGAQLLGKKDAIIRMIGLSTAIHANLTIEELAFIDFAYAPPFSKPWEPLNILGQKGERLNKKPEKL